MITINYHLRPSNGTAWWSWSRSGGGATVYGRNAFGMPVGLARHLFAAGVDREKTELAWRTWLDGLYT